MNGFIYTVYSKDGKPNKFFKDEFLVSHASLKKVLPKCNTTLYTNIVFENEYGINNVIYDKDIPKTHIAKAEALLRSPYKKTVFLDTDTYIHRSVIRRLFGVLDEFDFTCCYGNNWNSGSLYPDFNTGLIGVKNNDFTKREIKGWVTDFNNGKTASDQKAFRSIFMRNKIRFHILPAYFMHRWQHLRSYPGQAVLTHSHTMSKKHVTSKTIKIWAETC